MEADRSLIIEARGLHSVAQNSLFLFSVSPFIYFFSYQNPSTKQNHSLPGFHTLQPISALLIRCILHLTHRYGPGSLVVLPDFVLLLYIFLYYFVNMNGIL